MTSSLQLPLDVPTWHTGRLWMLRLGYYKLTRPKEQADDWVWIVDHTVQIGAKKCFIILGLRLSDLPPIGQCLSHQDVELIALLPVEKSNKEVVYRQLEAFTFRYFSNFIRYPPIVDAMLIVRQLRVTNTQFCGTI